MRFANFYFSFSFSQIPIIFFLVFLIIACFDISGDYVLVGSLTSTTSYGGSWDSGTRSIMSYVGLFGFFLAAIFILARTSNASEFSSKNYFYYVLLLLLALFSSFLVSLAYNTSYFTSAALEFMSLGLPSIYVLFLFQLPINYSCLLLCRLTLIVFFLIFAFKLIIALVVSQSLFAEVYLKLSSLIVPIFISSLFLPMRAPFVFKHVFFSLLCFFVLLLIGQRGYIVSGVIFSLFYLLYHFCILKFSRSFHYIHSFWLLVYCIVAALCIPAIFESFNDIGTSYRLEQFSALYQSFKESPFFGIGLGQPPSSWDSFLEVYKSFQMELDLPYQFVKFGILHSIVFSLSLYFLFVYSSQVRSAILKSGDCSCLDRSLSLDYFALRPEIFTISILISSLFQTAISSLIINFFISFFYFYQTVIYRTSVRHQGF
jgi:hypothetical protein